MQYCPFFSTRGLDWKSQFMDISDDFEKVTTIFWLKNVVLSKYCYIFLLQYCLSDEGLNLIIIGGDGQGL